MSSYEILAFENHSLYDSVYVNTDADVVNAFVKMCRRYVNPEYNTEEEVRLTKTKMTISYRDSGGNDKPTMVQLIGVITDELYKTIQEKLKRFYIHNCEDCGVEISLERVVCAECANK